MAPANGLRKMRASYTQVLTFGKHDQPEEENKPPLVIEAACASPDSSSWNTGLSYLKAVDSLRRSSTFV